MEKAREETWYGRCK